MSRGPALGLIIGSGRSALPFEAVARAPMKTPYGPPSSAVLTFEIGGTRVRAIARHGEPPSIAPHEINYRANVWALHSHGVRACIALNVVGTIASDFKPGQIAVPDQLIDYTWGREGTYGSEQGIRHIEFAEPFAAAVAKPLRAAAQACGLTVARGIYGVTQGPRLETAAEIMRLARDGCTMVGMTAMPEAALARELGIDYALCALGVNHAAGCGPGAPDAPIHAQIDGHIADGMAAVARVLETFVSLR